MSNRILHVITSLTTGGAETLLCGVVRELVRRPGTEVTIAALYPRFEEARRLEGTGVRVVCLDMRGSWDLARGIGRLKRLIREVNPTVVHAHLFPADLVTAAAAAGLSRRGVPLVFSDHSEWNRRRTIPWFRRVDGWTYSHYDRLVCVSGRVEESLTAWVPAVAGRTRVIRNAVPVPERQWSADGPFKTDVLLVGRMEEQKGVDVLLRALRLLKDRGRTVRTRIVGGGSLEAPYRALNAELGLEESVEFCGWRTDVEALMLRSRLLALPSRFEGLPMVLLEGMALGMPVLSSTAGGAPEVIRDGVSGLLVPPAEVEPLADALAAVLDDPAAAERMGVRARREILERYSMPAYADLLLDVYADAAQAPPHPAPRAYQDPRAAVAASPVAASPPAPDTA
jgi:glycosyltransferase involved in cell wall biosynthesis